ncbi:hypothetical protein D9613_010186 [Agrocybe pediades]|uniref:Uncharacterized protein n=1 Tax=Agrocybe pediades TaxID=84607 RepID=A0A8H4VQ33_9AGAR|nr:hypothetical protein D9613_010186 [Agrocybe pediades]
MRWTAPPDKREISLIFLSLAAYFFAYNIDASLQVIGIDRLATQGAVLSRLGIGKGNIAEDGRRPPGWRDALENEIFGDWTWGKNHVAGDGAERTQLKGSGRHGAMWLERPPVGKVDRRPLADGGVDDAALRWGDDIPTTKIVKQAPGYNILDNVFIFNGSVFLVTDEKNSLPDMSSMVASVGNGFGKWKIITTSVAHRLLGDYGGIIRGVSWLTADSHPHNSTLFALWRIYSSLDVGITSTGYTTLPPLRRLIFPHNRFFTDANPDFGDHWIRRRRVDTGFHPFLLKAAFPQLGMQYFEDWDDFHKMQVPYMYERLVVVDRGVSLKAVSEGQPAFAPPFSLPASEHWWKPVRKNLLKFLGEDEVKKASTKKVVTYLHTQNELSGGKLSDEDHDALSNALSHMAKKNGYQYHIVSTQTSDTDWTDRMMAIVKSSVIVSVHGDHLLDSVFMEPSPTSRLFELFPTSKFVPDRGFAVRSIGVKYTAWIGKKSYSSISDLEHPPVSPPSGNEEFDLDINAIVQSVQNTLESDS